MNLARPIALACAFFAGCAAASPPGPPGGPTSVDVPSAPRGTKDNPETAERPDSATAENPASGLDQLDAPATAPGNEMPLGPARVPFATYLGAAHRRIHPSYMAELESLERLGASHAANDVRVRAIFELGIGGTNGAIERIALIGSSGSAELDSAALRALRRAAPFGAPGAELLSADGRAYVEWSFHRDRRYACSVFFTRPRLLGALAPRRPRKWSDTPKAPPIEAQPKSIGRDALL